MTRRLFDRDEERGITQWFEPTDDGGYAIITEQDCEPIIEANKERQSYGKQYYKSKDANGEYWKAASIPIVIQYKWLVEDGIDVFKKEHWPAVKRKLNDPDWRWLKTAEIKI